MVLNADLTRRTLVPAEALPWVPSPAKGVNRRMLFRLGGERARATSIVRYAPGSQFARHSHPGGEELLVLEGTFQDETGDFPAGTYVRNPPGTGHAPASAEGCTIFVRLWQFATGDRDRIVRPPRQEREKSPRPGVLWSRRLFAHASEVVMMERWAPGAEIRLCNVKGLELLVLEGSIHDRVDELTRWSWLRLPAGETLQARVGPKGAQVWYKLAPLLHADVCPFESDTTLA